MSAFIMSRGVGSLLGSAGRKAARNPAFWLNGDLNQMAIQEEFLCRSGLAMDRSDVYPVLVNNEDIPKALKAIWNNRVEGWWNYEREFKEHRICTQREFDVRLGRVTP